MDANLSLFRFEKKFLFRMDFHSGSSLTIAWKRIRILADN